MVNALRADRHEVLLSDRNATSDLSERLTGNRCRARFVPRRTPRRPLFLLVQCREQVHR
jgi:hypothetical protein